VVNEMRIAVISDIHGNIDALESVLDDIRNRNVDQIISTGDLVGYLPYPNEVIESFRANGIQSILGNHDERIANHIFDETEFVGWSESDLQKNASKYFTSKTITDDNRAYLKALPKQMILDVAGKTLLFLHGTNRRIDEYLYEENHLLEEIAESLEVDVLVFGHTHIPYSQLVKGKVFINAGSVGKPKSGSAQSSYVIITLENGEVYSDIHQVPYETSKVCKAIKMNPYINDSLINSIREGK